MAVYYYNSAVFITGGNKEEQDLLKNGSKTIKETATVNDVIKSALKFTVNAVLGVTVNQVVFNSIQMCDNHDVAARLNSSFVMPEIV